MHGSYPGVQFWAAFAAALDAAAAREEAAARARAARCAAARCAAASAAALDAADRDAAARFAARRAATLAASELRAAAWAAASCVRAACRLEVADGDDEDAAELVADPPEAATLPELPQPSSADPISPTASNAPSAVSNLCAARALPPPALRPSGAPLRARCDGVRGTLFVNVVLSDGCPSRVCFGGARTFARIAWHVKPSSRNDPFAETTPRRSNRAQVPCVDGRRRNQ
jgi:hypothetical protein